MGCGCKNNKKTNRPNRNQLNADLINKVIDERGEETDSSESKPTSK